MSTTQQPAPPPQTDKDKTQPLRRPKAAAAWTVGILIALAALLASQYFVEDRTEISYTFFDSQIHAKNVKLLDIYGSVGYGEFVDPPKLPPESATTSS